MQMGFAVPVSGAWATPAHQVEIARRAEQLGYTTVWTFQRLLAPADPGAWAPYYRSVLDPLVTLGHLAGVTERVRLGVAVVNAPFVSPALLAKQLTTVDVLSRGRLTAGLGLGWSAEEYAASGVPRERRGRRLEEFIGVLMKLWTEEVAEHDGEFYPLPAVRQDPRPVQRPHPPLLLGGGAEAALHRAGRLADGWVSASAFDAGQLRAAIGTVRHAAEESGRDPEALQMVCRGAVRIRPRPEDGQHWSGPLEVVKERLAGAADAGVTEFFVDLNFDPEVAAPDADPESAMDRARGLLEEFAPGR